MAAAGLAENEQPPPPTKLATIPLRPGFTGGVNVPSAYYFRGYLQADGGLILQPYLNVFVPCHLGSELVVRPYLSLFHSAHLDEGNAMPDMTDVMLGAITSYRGCTLDARYAYYTKSPTGPDAVHELGVKASADLIYGCQGDSGAPFSFRPSVGLYTLSVGPSGTESVYLETGLEPSYRFDVAGTKVGVGLTLVWGLSVDDYYFDSRGQNEALGYFSATLSTSIALPVPEGCGQWFLNGSVQFLHLFADSAAAVNGGERNEVIGKIGVGFLF